MLVIDVSPNPRRKLEKKRKQNKTNLKKKQQQPNQSKSSNFPQSLFRFRRKRKKERKKERKKDYCVTGVELRLERWLRRTGN